MNEEENKLVKDILYLIKNNDLTKVLDVISYWTMYCLKRNGF